MRTQVTFIRHAENKPYAKGEPKYPGPGLTKKGILQAKKTAIYLKDFRFDRIYCSDMTRAVQTAKEIKKYQRTKVVYRHEFAEINRIIYDKKPADEEKLMENLKRVKSALILFKKILRENKGEKILIIAHGNLMHALIGTSLGIKLKDAPRFHMTNCAISTLVFEKEKVVGMPIICFDGHHIKTGFKEWLDTYNERVAFYSNPENRTR